MRKTVLIIIVSILFSGAVLAQDPEILWWFDLEAPSFGSSSIDDIDGDGFMEIVFGTYFNDEHIYALNAEDGSLLWSFDTGGCNDASPLIFDVDMDDELEVIIAASSPYHVYCFNGATGDIEWDVSAGFPNCIDSPPAAADVDNDGRPEIVFGTFYGHVMCINGEDGSLCWQADLGNNSYIQTGPNILDCDDDGQLDVVVAQWQGDCRIYALRGNDGSLLWFSDAPEDWMYHGGSFADIDEDGRPEIAIGCYDGDVYVLNAEDGSLLWEYSNFFYCGGPTSIADLNNDGHLEIVFTTYTTLKVLSQTGNLLWSYGTGGSIFRGAAISDTDGDGILDVVFGSDDGILRNLRGSDGQIIWALNLENHYGNTFNIDHAPVIADFDNDDLLDVFVIGGYGTSSTPTNNHGRGYALTAGNGTGPGWKMFRHDPVHSACFGSQENSVIVTLIPDSLSLTQIPFNGYFEFNIGAANNGASAAIVDIWTMVTLPTGAEYGPLIDIPDFTLNPGWSGNRDRTQEVPGSAPFGNYTYDAYIGFYPDIVFDEDHFDFEILPEDGDMSVNTDWNCFGESFDFIEEPDEILNSEFLILDCYPNPFNQQAAISFQLLAVSHVNLTVYDITGREVRVLHATPLQAGYHEVVWNAEGLGSGVYFARLQAGDFMQTRKMLLVK